MSRTLDAQELLDDLSAINRDAVQLATAVSLASRIEPALLRALRLALLPASDASAEADLWLSPLMSSRSALFAVMRPTVSDMLRERLCAEPQQLDASWKTLQLIHATAPSALRTEEEITWRVLANPDDPKIARLFESVAVAMEDGRSGLAKWAARALPRLPAQARQSGGAWRVAQKATEMLGGQPILEAELGPAVPASITSPFPIEKLPRVAVGLRLFDDALRISEPPEESSRKVDIPGTTPLLLELEWQEQGKVDRTTVSFGPGSAQLVHPVTSRSLKITTAARDVYAVQLLAEEWKQQEFTILAVSDGLAVRLYRGNNAVLLALDVRRSLANNLYGFQILRQAPGETEAQALGRVGGEFSTWQEVPGSQPSSTPIPIRNFRWLDPLPRDSTGQYTYRVSALAAGPSGPQIPTAWVKVSLDILPRVGDIEIGFTRGAFESSLQEPLKPERNVLDFETTPYARRYEFLGGSAYQLMMGFITACVQDPKSSLDVMAFDFDHPDILKAFEKLGKRLRIVLDDSPAHRNRQYELEHRLKQAGCEVRRSHFGRFSHSKVIIQKLGGEPLAVLTGSTNFSINSLFAQHNHVIVIRDKQIASIYEGYFEEATSKASKNHSWVSIERSGLPSMRVLICPSGELLPAVRDAIAAANRSVLFSLGDLSQSLVSEINELSKKIVTPLGKQTSVEESRVLVGGVVHSNSGQRVFWRGSETPVRPNSQRRKLTSTTTGATSGNGKFVVIDFDQPGAVVYAGSSAFSDGGVRQNGDDVLEIHDPSIATQFAIEALQMIDHCRFRAQQLKSAVTPDDESFPEWWKPYYTQGDPRSWERTLLANVDWPAEASIATTKTGQESAGSRVKSSRRTTRESTRSMKLARKIPKRR